MSLKIIHGVAPDGRTFTAFQCSNIKEDYWQWLADEQRAEDELREASRQHYLDFLRHDPNRIDGRKVRRELGDKMINLGRRVNLVPSRIKRRW